MNKKLQKVAGVTGSALMLVTMGTGSAIAAQTANVDSRSDTGNLALQESETKLGSSRASVAKVMGDFSFTQGEITPIDLIAKTIGQAPQHLCGAVGVVDAGTLSDSAAIGTIEIKGAVNNSYTATVEEMLEEAQETVVLGCSCAGNPADGKSSVNAEVTGIAVGHMLELADPKSDANTIIFTSADGYEVALPLNYVTQRYCPIVFDVNGSPLVDSVGGTNQLWLGSTAARYFARDIVTITLEERQTPPPVPGSEESGDTYANLPNIGVYFGGEIR